MVRPARERWPQLAAPSKLAKLKFRSLIRPGDALDITLERRPDGVSFQVRRAGEEVASGQVVHGGTSA